MAIDFPYSYVSLQATNQPCSVEVDWKLDVCTSAGAAGWIWQNPDSIQLQKHLETLKKHGKS